MRLPKKREMYRRRRPYYERKEKTYAATNNEVNKGRTIPQINRNENCQKMKPTYTTWENIVLHYLSKLKNMWKSPSDSSRSMNLKHPTPGVKETSDSKFKKFNADTRKERVCRNPKKSTVETPEKYSSITNKPTLGKPRSNYDIRILRAKQKAYNIVSTAIEYGLANGILKRNGSYFKLQQINVSPSKTSRNRMIPFKNCGSCKCFKLCKRCESLARDLIKKRAQTNHPKIYKKGAKRRSKKISLTSKASRYGKRLYTESEDAISDDELLNLHSTSQSKQKIQKLQPPIENMIRDIKLPSMMPSVQSLCNCQNCRKKRGVV